PGFSPLSIRAVYTPSTRYCSGMSVPVADRIDHPPSGSRSRRSDPRHGPGNRLTDGGEAGDRHHRQSAAPKRGFVAPEAVGVKALPQSQGRPAARTPGVSLLVREAKCANGLMIAVTFDPARGYVTVGDDELPLAALSLSGLRRR